MARKSWTPTPAERAEQSRNAKRGILQTKKPKKVKKPKLWKPGKVQEAIWEQVYEADFGGEPIRFEFTPEGNPFGWDGEQLKRILSTTPDPQLPTKEKTAKDWADDWADKNGRSDEQS